MPSALSRGFAALVAVVGIVASVSPCFASWPRSPYSQVQVAPTGLDQKSPIIVSDGMGGVFVAWVDRRAGNADIYAQHVDAAGDPAGGLWPATGLPLCMATGDQTELVGVADGSGGAIFAWRDQRAGALADIYAIRVDAAGSIVPGWPADGRLLTHVNQVAKDERTPRLDADGAGGAVIVWTLVFTATTDNDIYGAHLNPDGTIAWCVSLYYPGGVQDQPSVAALGPSTFAYAFYDANTGSGDIRVEGRTMAGGYLWNTLLGTATEEGFPMIMADGAGGSFATWLRWVTPTNYDVLAAHLLAGGGAAVGWSTDGAYAGAGAAPLPFSGFPPQRGVLDGSDGVYVLWGTQTEGFSQHFSQIGTHYAGFPYDGKKILDASGSPAVFLDAIGDGHGGVYAAGLAQPSGPYAEVWMDHLDAQCESVPGWSGGAPAFVSAAIDPFSGWCWLALDGLGRVAFTEPGLGVNATYAAAVAQVVDRFGRLGDVTPAIAGVHDVSGDQGGQVRLDWMRSPLDAEPSFELGSYWIWREVPAATAQAALNGGATRLDETDPAMVPVRRAARPASLAPRGLLRHTDLNGVATWWEFVDSTPAAGYATYSRVIATTRDSLPGENPLTVFQVQARHQDGVAFWDSAPDSGYSVDNLVPAAPAPFSGYYESGRTFMSWGPNAEPDLSHYVLHRGNTPGFDPDGGNLVAATTDTTYVDPLGVPAYYKLAAVDAHGNVSAYALLEPTGTVDVPGGVLVTALAFDPPMPHPIRGPARLRFAMPVPGDATVQIFDVSGRLVRDLARGRHEAGVHELVWDPRQGVGRIAAGVYFARLTALGRTLQRRLVVMP